MTIIDDSTVEVTFAHISRPQRQLSLGTRATAEFHPLHRPLIAGYDSQASAVTFTFDQRGILAGTSSTQSGMGTGPIWQQGQTRQRVHTKALGTKLL